MAALINFLVGIFTPNWRNCLAIGACVAAVSVILFSGPKIHERDTAYIVGFMGAAFILDLFVAVIGHGVRRLFIKFAG